MLDVIMASPTAVSSHQLHGASHITGGIFRSHAQGNQYFTLPHGSYRTLIGLLDSQ